MKRRLSALARTLRAAVATGDITNPPLIFAKGFLFLVLGTMAAGLLLLEAPSLRVAALLAIAVWAFCRSYYFAFYVIEHYVDPSYRFAGIWSFLKYAVRRGKSS